MYARNTSLETKEIKYCAPETVEIPVKGRGFKANLTLWGARAVQTLQEAPPPYKGILEPIPIHLSACARPWFAEG